MESYDERRRREEERRQGRQEDGGRHRDSWWHRGGRDEDDRAQRGEQRSQRAETGWLDYDRDYGRSNERQGRRDEGREEYSRFSPDWSREGAEPRYSDNPYYARNREQSSGDYSRRTSGWQNDDRREWEQRARASVPRSQRELAEHGEPGDYYDPDWPYDRGGQRRDMQRSRGEQRSRGREDEGSHYRGYYSQSGGPFSYPGGQGYVFSESLTLHGPYTGRGPKGYKRSDEKIMEEACQRLERDGDIDASEIEVTAEDGVIRLRGTVEDRQTKRRAEECIESIYGVRDVMNELRVSHSGAQQRQGSQGTQSTQSTQSGRGSMQTSQGGQAGQGSQATSTPGMRQGEQSGDDKLSPRH